jgi:hypothetical protein
MARQAIDGDHPNPSIGPVQRTIHQPRPQRADLSQRLRMIKGRQIGPQIGLFHPRYHRNSRLDLLDIRRRKARAR